MNIVQRSGSSANAVPSVVALRVVTLPAFFDGRSDVVFVDERDCDDFDVRESLLILHSLNHLDHRQGRDRIRGVSPTSTLSIVPEARIDFKKA
ncbi:hypothetical protein PENPOL_c007G08335 [Penicillium polonicum]|uniref:Uncharacterized protein n=1 Tax=Penicillium polonicum TaxID=60169 RepID=A0A1V6NIH6_PENPO|nr:hypothetical protein PENPOL_c007G08335 [Penicillium polonicum]